jgi:hypothetical protein
MNIKGHGLRDHIRLVGPLFGLVAAVWALRLILAAAGAPRILVHAFAVTLAVPICIMLAVFLIHIRRFGSYANVVLGALLLVAWGELLISAAIAFSALTGIETVYSEPEFSFGIHSPWKHIAGHMTFGIGFGTLFGAAMGCLLLWMLHRLPADTAHANRR